MVLLNLDAGEHPDEPEMLWAAADILCAACGGHAGDAASMSRIAAFCAARTRPRLGAHPSYPDKQGFGRRSLAAEVAPASLARSIASQLAELTAAAAPHGMAPYWVKPHGALYHDAAASEELARVVIEASVLAFGETITIIGPPKGALHDVARARGLAYLREGFADRRVRPDGSLVPRTEPDALITDPTVCAARAMELAASGAIDTVCLHADTPNAPAIAAAVRAALGPFNERNAGRGVPRFEDLGVPGVVPIGDRAVRIPRPPGTTPRAIIRAVRAWPRVVDVVVAREGIGVYFDRAPWLDAAAVAALATAREPEEPSREHVLRVVYDGADLAEVARATKLSVDEVILRHTATIYVVDAMGFLPGFAYLDGLDPALAVPRLATPRERVPVNSVAIAGAQTAVYPFETPGGWHLLGRALDVTMFHPVHGALLGLGDRVRFVRV